MIVTGIPLAEAQAQLLTVNTAIQNLISGQRITELSVGSGAFKQMYKYQEITMDNLRQIRAELLEVINIYAQQNGSLPVFAKNMQIPMVVQKDHYNVWQDRGIY